MAIITIVKTIGSTGVFSTPALWDSGGPNDLTLVEQSAATTFAVATFIQGEGLTFVGSGATALLLDTDSTGPGTGSYITYDIVTGNPAASDVVTGDASTATCILTSGTPMNVGCIWQGQCQNQEFVGVSPVVAIAGSATSSVAYKELTTVAGASFMDNANIQNTPLRYNAANGCGIRASSGGTEAVDFGEPFARISKLQIASDLGIAMLSDCGGGLVRDLILEGKSISSSTTAGVFVVRLADTIINVVVVQRNTGADHIVSSHTGSPSFYNCTFVAVDDAAAAPVSVFTSGASGTVTVQNCGLFAGDSTKAIKAGSATFNFTTCYSDISGTAGVTQTTYGNEFQNVNDATRDFRLKSGAAQIDTGTTDTTNAAIDIAKTNRPSGAAYDVGAWEFVQAGGGATVITGFGRRPQVVAG